MDVKSQSNHNHKKRKDSLKTRAKLRELSYTRTHSSLPGIKCKETKEQGSEANRFSINRRKPDLPAVTPKVMAVTQEVRLKPRTARGQILSIETQFKLYF